MNRFRRFFPFQRSNIRKRTDEKKVSRLLRRQKNEKQGERNRWERKKGKKLTKKGQQTERRKETERAISLFYCGRNSKKEKKTAAKVVVEFPKLEGYSQQPQPPRPTNLDSICSTLFKGYRTASKFFAKH